MLRALTVTERDAHLANTLLSALIYAWDDVPSATQARLLRDAALMMDGNKGAAVGPQLLRFIETYQKLRGIPANPL
jgi:hypothetical protein